MQIAKHNIHAGSTGHKYRSGLGVTAVGRPTLIKSRTVIGRAAQVPLHGNKNDSQLNSNNSDGAERRCPFLAGLKTPPTIKMPWHQRALEVFHPGQFQKHILEQRGEDTVVRGSPMPGFFLNSLFMPATMELTKAVFAEEPTGAVTQGMKSIPLHGFAELLGEECLLVVEDHARHAYLRTLLNPAFNAASIASYMPAIEALVARHLASWEAAGQGGVLAYKALKKLTFEFIVEVVMGHPIPQAELAQLDDMFGKFSVAVTAWPCLDIPFTPYSKGLKARKQLMSFFQIGVTKARQQLADGQDVPGVMGRLVAAVDEQGNRLTDREICENLLMVLFAGFDTSSTTLTRVLSNLENHPAVMQKLREEQRAVKAKHGEHISPAALKDMVYAEAVIRETLRLDPTVNLVGRVATRDFKLGDYRVPAGQLLSIPLKHLAQHDPRWEGKTGDLDPEVLNPNRLLTPEGAKPGQLMPFGTGARHCLGASLSMAEMKTFLALLARSYSFTADTNTAWKNALGYYPVNGLPLVLVKSAADIAA